jgi:hypothetical protein
MAVPVVVAMVVGLVGLLGASPTTAGAQAAPTFSVTPSTGLVDQQVVRIEGSGFPAGALVGFSICPLGVPYMTCAFNGPVITTATASGTVGLDYQVLRFVGATDCAPANCEIAATALAGGTFGPEVRRPIQFVGDAEETPELSAVLDLYGTVDDAGVAVASAVISCDRPTQVFAVGELYQDLPWGDPGPSGSFSLTDQCTPEEPVWAFFPFRSTGDDDDPGGDWRLDSAKLSVSFRPTAPAGVPLESEFADITLIDHEPLAAAIQITIQDPAEVELRERIVRAIQARIRQDPIFAAEWRALLGG